MRQFVGPVATDSAPSAATHLTRKDYVDAGDSSAISSAASSAAGLYLPILGAITAKTASYTLLDTDAVVVANSTSSALTMTLPTAVGRTGRRFVIKKLGGSTANPVTIASNGGTIDGASTEVVSIAGGFRELISDGTNWHIIGGKIEPVIVNAGSLAAGTWTIDASIGNIYRASATGTTLTIAPPTASTAIDGDAINIELLNSNAASCTVTLSTGTAPNTTLFTTGITSPFTVPTGKRLFLGLRFIGGIGWVLLAAQVQS